ncbi:hypothetical protein A2V68_00125 [candidate division Kazan bacterium RBG_13_50_9]|uniref:Methyltransferase type 11 domain-containing protein n=1 Tax=candidate division Kazan bacterium RBG_13_50_9 TaxID=1798535 RepID=A0A1F4NSC2_UNCK3|nr:MAG: hypothetical protein A2V68_00125 [candidate division Kazan bacterium RBG_13_50_9]
MNKLIPAARALKKGLLRIWRQLGLHSKLCTYRAKEMQQGQFKVILGGHWSKNPGWLILDEIDQDITKPLVFPSSSVDVIFTEHVIEHINLTDGIHFLHEAKRVLKPGGVLRIVSPMTERILSATFEAENDQAYIQNCLINQTYPNEHRLLTGLGLRGIYEAPQVFMLNSLFREHSHQFIWSAQLMVKVLLALGYSEAKIRSIGEGRNPDYCIERRQRGLHLVTDWRENLNLNKPTYDIESVVVEAIK